MIVGIDLGTTNSLVAYYTDEGPKIIPNRLGSHITPSVVSIDDNNIYVGDTAKERARLHPEQSAEVFKRDMGSKRVFKLGSKEFSAQELSSFVLRSLKEDAEAFLGQPVEEAVISVPAYFNDMRRKATKRAGELAGLKVERIINEPTAAAIAYGLYDGKKSSKNLVFDLGGGTLDVSILDYFSPILEVRAVAGDNFLGGEDFTKVVEDLFFGSNPILDREKLSMKDLAMVRKAAELTKQGVSKDGSSVMRVVIDGKEYTYKLTYENYENALKPLYDRIRIPVRRALTDAKLKLSDIDKVVLVGGATKYVGVRSFVGKIFHTFPSTDCNPDEAIALGAAIEAAMKDRAFAVKEVILTDVCPFTMGTEVCVDRGDGIKENGHYSPIIERNTIIPASRTKTFYTSYDNQTKINVNILQGESRFAENNLEIGELEIEVPKNKEGMESVDVTYTYDINSILEVEVKVNSTGRQYKKIIKGQYTDMTDEEIEARFKELSYLKIAPRDQEENKLVLLRSERLYEELLGNDRDYLESEIVKFEYALMGQDKRQIELLRKRLTAVMDEIEAGF